MGGKCHKDGVRRRDSDVRMANSKGTVTVHVLGRNDPVYIHSSFVSQDSTWRRPDDAWGRAWMAQGFRVTDGSNQPTCTNGCMYYLYVGTMR